MCRRFRWLLGLGVLLGMLLFGLNLWAQEVGLPVVAIRVEGNTHINTQLILSAVSLSLKEPFDPQKVEQDVKSIYDLGYFAKVWVETKRYPDGIEVIYKVEELPVIQGINIQGNTVLSTEEIRQAMIIAPGQVMNWHIFQRDLERIKALYSNRGFLMTAVENIRFDEQGVLHFTIKEGIVERVEFEGLQKTKEYVLRRELTFTPPIVFDFAKIKESMRAIYNLGFFEDITMKLEPGSDRDHVIVKVKVVEKATGEAGIGIGYNSEKGWLGFVRYQESNFGGNAQKLELRYEFGARTLYRISFEEPWLFGEPIFFGVALYDKVEKKKHWVDREVVGEYEEERLGGQVALGGRFGDAWQWRIQYKSEDVTITPLEGEPPRGDGKTNSLAPTIVYDTRDDVFNPREGWYCTLQVEFAGGFLGGDYNYTKYVLDARNYINAGENAVLALRLLGGIADRELPSFEKFSVGGVNTLRGYDLYEFQGEKMLVANLEYRLEVAKNTQLVIFGDAGYAWDLDEPVHLDDVKIGYGVGLRFDTPVGPIRLDYGIGESGSQTYVSIGQTF
ncbi:MAG: BamA/TamA family outer membrane protein [Candidatus Caldatribacterium sp.]|nr:BamA/TamA family outer membrane protein [Candidatus Caldatribacterium sp.]